MDGVEVIKDKKSFFWSGRYHEDMNSRDTLVTDLNVLADFDPKLPESYLDSEFIMLGNLQPAVQMNVIKQLKKTETDRDGYDEFLDGISNAGIGRSIEEN